MRTLSKSQNTEIERIRSWACCLEPERRFMAEITVAELLEALELCYTRIFNYQAGMDELRDPKTTARLNNDALVPAQEAIRKAQP